MDSVSSKPVTSCRLCEGRKLAGVLKLSPTPPGDRYMSSAERARNLPLFPLSLNLCQTCGHVQLGAVVDPDYLYGEYIYTTSSSLGLADHFARYASATCGKLGLKPGSLVVEIGSNDGTMLRAFKDLGMRVLGVDPARDIAKRATDSGIETLAEFFTRDIARKIRAEHGSASLVVANNVMANVADVRAVVEAVRELLAPHGVFVFETGYLKYLAEDHVFDNIYHEHIDYYSVGPLDVFFRSLNMQLFDVEETASKGSSIRCFVGLGAGGRVASESVALLKEREGALGYHTPLPYQRLGVLLRQTRSKLHAFLDDAAAKGLRIAGFGASVGVTTALYEFDLKKYITCLLDDNAARDGLYSPGLAIPVLLAERALADSDAPDVVVLLAWRYADGILAKHRGRSQNRTRFIKFLPEFEVIGDA